MDSFNEPTHAPLGDLNIDDVRAEVRRLEAEHQSKGMKLSGRIVHVCHYLPVVATLTSRTGVLSPPQTPPTKPADVSITIETPTPTTAVDPPPKWSIAPRHGHAAMISGIRSLAETHQQVIVGWTGDIVVGHGEKIPSDSVSSEDRAALQGAIATYKPHEDEEENEHAGDAAAHAKTTYVPVWQDDKVAHGHYDGYCKTTLWPLFHYLLWQDVATEYASADEHYGDYEAANESYAARIADIYQPGDLIWVHDYHLMLVPRLLRQRIPDAVVGLFVHTPFPSSEVFRCLPRRKEILDGMLGANLVCFQTYSYSRHFISSCIRVCGYETAARGIDNQGHITAVSHTPVGVDAERIARDVLRPGIQPKLAALRSLYEGKKIIVGRDKLDVVKGVVQKLRAFEKLLHDYPEWIGNVVMIQVTSPALSDSLKLERQVSELVAHINGEYGSLDFIPVHHYHQTIKKDEFYALLSVADLAVITPLRDGMNTTSMEFVIAQERTKKAPLVLSEFMGISNNMQEALQINPWNLGDVAAAMNRGLLMPETERRARHEQLHKMVTRHTSSTWAAELVRMLLSQIGSENTAHQTPFLARDKLRDLYKRAKKRLFLFDYDGTLTPIVKMPSMAVPSQATLEALQKLSEDPRNLVFIISGRDGEFLEQHLGHLTNVGMSAEHGGFMREPGSKEWQNLTKELDMSWMTEVEEIFRYYTERTTGSHIEIKKSSITWHYRASDPEWGLFQCRQCQDLLENNLAHKRPIEVLVGKKNLEVRPIAVNKGEIVKRILYHNPDAEFIFCAGDDKTDEDMFRALVPYTSNISKPVMTAPVSVNLLAGKTGQRTPPKTLAISPEGVFSTAVGASSKKTLAQWHVTTPQEVVESMLDLVNLPPSDPKL
ncbi:trehalose-6-phosphate phosphatase [Rickenella mellea]|uniref:Trehalose-6-phosphate phosphatase n=1 Tax=Rickenella mellea TaxID=50990 RepID=A0A4Y7Q6I6_9AGAM|nr:trehalose-6-phosphate phosphatase [Rickenella mellea]